MLPGLRMSEEAIAEIRALSGFDQSAAPKLLHRGGVQREEMDPARGLEPGASGVG